MAGSMTFLGFCDKSGHFAFDVPAAYKAFMRQQAGKELEVEIRERRSRRSDRQNRAFWAALTPWAHFLGYEPTELKNELMALLWGYEEQPSALTGEMRMVPVKGRSSKLNTQEMSELMEFAAVKAAETGYVMELPDEFKARKQQEAKEAKKGRAA
jgi:hypothetical protein